MLDVFFAILPIFLVIGFGLIADRLELLPAPSSSLLSLYVLRLALPVMLFRIMAGADPAQMLRGGFWAGLFVSQFFVYGLGYGVERLLARRGKGEAVTTALSCSSGIAAFIGLPVVQFLLPGNNEALLAAGLAAIMPSMGMAVGQVHYEVIKEEASGVPAPASTSSHGGSASSRPPVWAILFRAIFRNPLIIALAAGSLLGLTGLGLWGPLDRTAAFIGSTSAPCVLLALGLDLRSKLRLALRASGGNMAVRQAGVSVAKLLVHPLLAWGIMHVLGVTGLWLAVGVIMSATSTAVGAYALAEVYGQVSEEAAFSVVITSGLSLFTMSGFAYAFRAAGWI